jgi:4-amino-4-deoxy-L-arabinose transferase-like glycosyltransferase
MGALSAALEAVSAHHLAIVLLAAFVIRAPILFALDTVTVGWHSADYGSIARNFYRNGYHLFYPQIDWGGDGPGYVEMEFPIVPWLTALIYGVVGGANDRWAVVVPFVSGMLAVWLAYRLAARVYRPSVAVLAGLLVAVSPVLARFGQLAFPEASMVAASTGAIYAIVRWHDSGRVWYVVVAALSIALALLLKPTALVLGAPLLFVFWRRYGWALWKRWELYLLGVIALAPPLVWYAHALTLAQDYGNSFGILLGGGSNKLAELALLVDPAFYRRLAERITVYHLTLGGALGLLWSVRSRPQGLEWIVPIWLGSTALTLFVAAGGNYDVAYYQLPMVTPACLVAAVGLAALDADLSRWVPRHPGKMAAVLATCVGAGVVVGSVLHYVRSDYVPFTLPMKQQSVKLGGVLDPGTLIVYSENQATRDAMPRGQHVTPPVPFYFSDRRGWYLATDWATPDEVEGLRARGARYFVVADVGVLRRERPAVVEHLDGHYARVPADVGFAVWDLARRETLLGPAP